MPVRLSRRSRARRRPAVLVCELLEARAVPASSLSGFNDASGLYSDGTVDSPYHLGNPLAGQGAGEPGWAGPWAQGTGNASDAIVQSGIVYEGDGALKVVGGTTGLSRDFNATASSGKLVVTEYLYVPSGGAVAQYVQDRQIQDTAGATAAQWRGVAPGAFEVLDSGQWENTGIAVPIDQWFRIDLRIDMTAETYEFYVNQVRFNAPDPIGFRGDPVILDRLAFLITTAPGGPGFYADNIQVSNGNVAFADQYTVSEDTQRVVGAPGVRTNDLIQTATPQAEVVSGPSHAAQFALNVNGSFTYTPAANYTGTDSFTYRVVDGSDASQPATVTLTVQPVNDAPTLSGANDFTTVTEDDTDNSGDLVSDLLAGRVGDADADPPAGAAVVGQNAANGSWEFSADGSSWSSVTATSDANAQLLLPSYRLRFVPDGKNGTAAASVTLRAWDQSAGGAGATVDLTATGTGGATPYSSQTATTGITVTDVNDAPALTGTNAFAGITEDDLDNPGALVSDLVLGNATDVDAGADKGVAVVAVNPGNGTWEFSADGGTNWDPVGTVAAGKALLLLPTYKVRLVPDGLNATTASLTLRAWDQTGATAGQEGTVVDVAATGGTTAFSSATATANLTVSAANDPPTLDDPSDVSGVRSTPITFTATAHDPDAGHILTFSLVSAPTGATITPQGDIGLFIWAPDDTVAAGDYTFFVRVQDQGGAAAQQSVTVTVLAAGLVNGDLVVAGTAGGETIVLQPDGSKVSVSLGGQDLGSFDVPTSPHTINVVAGGGNDTIAVGLAAATVVDGGTGLNTLDLGGLGGTTTWNVTGIGAGTAGQVSFSSIASARAGDQADSFVFSDGARLVGTIDGGGGADSLNYSAWAGPVTVDLNGRVQNVEAVTGGGGSDILVGPGGPTVAWQVTGVNAGSAGGVAFAGFENLTGGPGDDTFAFADGARIAGRLDGAGGANGLNYAAYTTAVTVNLPARSGTGVGSLLMNIRNIRGGSGNDTLTGDALDNLLDGGPGDDKLVGGEGNDTYRFKADAPAQTDTVVDTRGTDTLDFSPSGAGVTVDLSKPKQAVNANLTLVGSGFENVIGGAGSDSLKGTGAANLLVGGPGDDILAGGGGNDVYAFNADGPQGADVITDTAGTDTLDFAAGTLGVAVDLSQTGVQQTANANLKVTLAPGNPMAIENLVGSAGDDNLAGNALANVLTGGPGDDALSGGAGNDVYRFNADDELGDDTVTDTGGIDLLDYAASHRGVTVDLSRADAQPVSPANPDNPMLTLPAGTVIENLTGGAGDDALTGNGAANVLSGGLGNDRYRFAADQGQGGGADKVVDAGGVDSLEFSPSTQGVTADLSLPGAQKVNPVNPTFTVSLPAGAVIENLTGGTGNDVLRGTAGNNVLAGGPGDDRYVVKADTRQGADTVQDNAGTDTLDFSAGGTAVAIDLSLTAAQVVNKNLTLTLPGQGVENVLGTGGNDTLTGNAADNLLVGRNGNDSLAGGGGRNLLIGGMGTDTVSGSDGDDLLVGGATVYDANLPTLLGLSAEWFRTDADYDTRVAHLKQGGGLQLANTFLRGPDPANPKNKATVTNDFATDVLNGGADADWFFFSTGDLRDTDGPGGEAAVQI